MRKKLWFAVLSVTILSVAAGAHFFGRTNAQDPPKKVDAEPKELKKDDWFENLKKALEKKKENTPLPVPAPTLTPAAPNPLVPPPLPALKDEKSVIPPPTGLPSFPADARDVKNDIGKPAEPVGLPPLPGGKKPALEPLPTPPGPASQSVNAPKPELPKQNAMPPSAGLPPIVGDPGPIAPLSTKPETSAPPVVPAATPGVKPQVAIQSPPISNDPPKLPLPTSKPAAPADRADRDESADRRSSRQDEGLPLEPACRDH